MTNTITTKQVNFIVKLNPSIDVKTIENLTTIEASKLIKKLLRETPKQEVTKLPTLQELKAKYNLGVELDDEGRFYCGKNNSCDAIKKLQDKHDKEHKHIEEYSIAKELKAIIKKEFNINISATSKVAGYTGEIRVLFKAALSELKKPFEELNEKELYDFANCISHHWEFRNTGFYLSSTHSKLKELYELSYKPTEFALIEKYKIAYEFAKEYLKSFQYDHTGSNMCDYDYIDCNFFSFVNIDIIDDFDIFEASNKQHELIEKVISEVANA